MQYKTFVALLFATAALAAPAADSDLDYGYGDSDDSYDSYDSYDNYDNYDNYDSYDSYDNYDSYEGVNVIVEDVPSSILSVIETAIPTSWLMSVETNAAFRSAEISEARMGTYPAWYSSLPQSVKQWETSAALGEASGYPSYYMTILPMPTSAFIYPSSSDAISKSPASSTPLTGSPSTSTATATATNPAGNSASSSTASQSGSTSTFTGGAPAATGGVAMSFAGAAGILGLALAL